MANEYIVRGVAVGKAEPGEQFFTCKQGKETIIFVFRGRFKGGETCYRAGRHTFRTEELARLWWQRVKPIYKEES